MAMVLLAAGLGGCPSKDPSPAPAPVASPSAVPVADVPRAGSKPASDAGGSNASAGAALALARAWNAAINAHDDKALGALYDDEVELYGSKVTRERAMAMKRAAFPKHVRDDLDNVEATGDERVSFHKKSTSKGGGVVDVQGYLELVRRSVGLRIRTEGDLTTDTNLARAKEMSCEEAVSAAAMSTKEAKAAQASIQKGADEMADVEEVHVGGMTVPPSVTKGPWIISICENHPDRMPCYYHFEVDPKTGVVTYDGMAEEPHPLAIDPKLVAAIKSACGQR
jgi:hypothetical protein